MILERLQKIENRAQAARDDSSLRQDLTKVERITQRVEPLARTLEKVVGAYRELVDRTSADCSDIVPKLRVMHEALTAMTDESRAQQLYGATTDFAEKFAAMERATKTVEGALTTIWTTYRNEQQKSAVDRELLETLSRSGIDVASLLEKYDKASFELEMLEGKPLPATGDTARWQAYINDLAQVADGLTGVVPEALATFFRTADSPEGAPLSTLTPDVRAFLDEHDIAERYSIRIRR